MTKRKYKVVITEEVIEEVSAGQEWEEGVDASTEDRPKGYGYSPKIIKKEKVTKDILIQEVDDLDLPSVIKAINKL